MHNDESPSMDGSHTTANYAIGSSLHADSPISDMAEDRLDRRGIVEQLAETILGMRSDEGFVFGLYGSWGSGKTSVINMTLTALEELQRSDTETVVFKFNPWWFSGQDQLLTQFLRQFAAVLGQRDTAGTLKNIGAKLNLFGRALAPLSYIPVPIVSDIARSASSAMQDIGAAATGAAQDLDADVIRLREQIDQAIREQPLRLLVVIDDVDRLSDTEIRQVFQVVKSIANFPKTIYLLAFDYDVVVKALDRVQNERGQAYLEKVVQLSVNLPSPDRTSLYRMLGDGLQVLITGPAAALFDPDDWWMLNFHGFNTLISTPRNVNRLLNALRATYPAVAHEVNAVDFIGIQALRVLAPKVYAEVERSQQLLTSDLPEFLTQMTDEERNQAFERILDDCPDMQRKAVERILRHLFPIWDGSREQYHRLLPEWRDQRRVCVPEQFDLYFRLSLSADEMMPSERQRIIASADDADSLGQELLTLANEERQDGSSRLATFLDQADDFSAFSEQQAEPILRALCAVGDELLDRMASDNRGIFDPGRGGLRLIGMPLQVVKKVSKRDNRFALLKDAFEGATSLSVIAQYLAFLGDEHGMYGGTNPIWENDRTVDDKQLSVLASIVVKHIQAAVEDGSLARRPRLDWILRGWTYWEDQDAPKQFVADLIKTDEGVANYAVGFARFYKYLPIGARTAQLKADLNVEIKRYCGPSFSEFVGDCIRILQENPQWLTDKQRVALEAVLAAVDRSLGA